MKKLLLAALLAATALCAHRADACSSFGQAQGCWDCDPCSGTCEGGPYCNSPSDLFDANSNGPFTIVCPTSCPNGEQCGANLENIGTGQVQFYSEICVVNSCNPACGFVQAYGSPGNTIAGYNLDCGGCFGNETCVNNQCVCSTRMSCPAGHAGDACGSVSDGCGGLLNCSCASGVACVGTTCETPMSCTPKTCGSSSCGYPSDGCGGTLNCGFPANGSGMVCVNNQLEACTHTSCAAANGCGTIPDGNCPGATLPCGNCPAGEYCSGESTCLAGPPAPAAPRWALGGLAALLLGFGVALMKRVG